MADRTVKVTLLAQATGYIQGFDQAAKKTRELGSEAEKLAQKKAAFEQVGRSALLMGGVIAAGVALAVSKWAEFDQQMSYVQAATHETAANMGLLKDAAIDAGARTVFSATEAAAAIEELAKAGVSTADILSGGLDSALDLAAAGGLGVADAAGIASVALKTFGLSGKDMGHVADLLAAGAGKAMGSVGDLSAALAQGGQVAKNTGLSIDETTAGLAAFASQGLIGSDAGTSFKSMLQRLTPQSKEAALKMEELGISAYDASGNFVGLANFAGVLQTALAKLTPEQRNSALATIFGSDAVRAATVLYSEGATGIQGWIDAVNDQGYAAETAALRLDNLKGDWEQLTGAMDSALISSGEAADGFLRSIVQSATGAIDLFNGLPVPMQQAALGAGGVAAAVALATGAFMVGVPKVAEYRAQLELLGPTAQRAGRSLTTALKVVGVGTVIAAAATGVWELSSAIKEGLQPSAEDLANSLKTATSAAQLFNETTVGGLNSSHLWFDSKPMVSNIEDFRRAMSDAKLESQGFFGWLDANTAIDRQDAFQTFRDGWQRLGEQMAKSPETIVPAFQKIRDEYGASRDELARLIDMSEPLKAALTAQATDAGLAASSGQLLAFALGETSVQQAAAKDAADESKDALRELGGQASSTKFDVQGLADAIRGFGSAELNTREAARDLESGFLDLADSIKKNGTSLDIHTEKGIANENAIDRVAQSVLNLSASTLEQTGNQDAANQVIADGRQRLIDMLAQFGITGQAAEDYANKVGLVPAKIDTAVTVSGIESAEAEISRLTRERWAKIKVSVDPVNDAARRQLGFSVANAQGNLYERARPRAFAAGGFASGIYEGVWGGIHKFAERDMGVPWETYISGRSQDRERNRDIWAYTGRLLGAWQPAPASYGSSAAVASSVGTVVNASVAVTANPSESVEAQAMRFADRLRAEMQMRGR